MTHLEDEVIFSAGQGSALIFAQLVIWPSPHILKVRGVILRRWHTDLPKLHTSHMGNLPAGHLMLQFELLNKEDVLP